MSNIEALRALAMGRAQANHPLELILDDTLRAELAEARNSLHVIQAQREKLEEQGDVGPAIPASLADAKSDAPPTPDIDRMIEKAKQVIELIEDEARDANVVIRLNFRRLAPEEYQVNIKGAERAARKAAKADPDVAETAVFMRDLGERLLKLCYTGASSLDGDDLNISLDDLSANVLDHADREALHQHSININRAGQIVPFGQRNSGRPATN